MKNKFVLLLVFLAFVIQTVLASHIIGGEMSYTCLGNNDYQIELKLYRDCYGGQASYDDPTNVFIFDSFGNLVNTLPISFPGSDTLPVVSNCGVPIPFVCVEEAVFNYVVNLPLTAGGYTLVYQRCCLSGFINNVEDAFNSGLSIFATIPDMSLASCNNSPQFISYPPIVFCTGVPISFDHSAVDVDGDSLVYELCAAISGANTLNPYPNPAFPPPYTDVIYADGYSGAYPMNSDPALAIDPATGEITGIPTAVGAYIVCVCAKEYRNGNLLAVHRRVISAYTEAYYLGIENTVMSGALNIFPNPVNDVITIDFSGNALKNDAWRIYNSNGDLVNTSLVEGGVNSIELNVHSYAEGIYHFEWIHDGKVITKSFIVSK